LEKEIQHIVKPKEYDSIYGLCKNRAKIVRKNGCYLSQ